MQVWLRLLRVGGIALLRRRDSGIDQVSRLSFRVSPGDLDVNLHMNNGRILSIMDLGRIDILIRTGLWAEMRRRGLTAVVGSQRIRYRTALSPWERFWLESRVLAWDDDSVVFEHAVVRKTGRDVRHAASATARVALIPHSSGGRRPKVGDVMGSVGFDRSGPPLPDDVATWLALERRALPLRPQRDGK